MKTVLRLLGFVRGNWWLFAWAFVAIVISTGFAILIPRMLGQGVDLIVTSGKHSTVIIIALVIIGAGALRGGAGYVQRFLNEVVSQRASYRIRNALYERLQRLSFAFHDQSQTGQLMSRATVDVEAVRMFFSMGMLGMLQTIVMVVGVYIMMLSINHVLALITLAFVVPVAWVAATFGKRIRPIWLRVQQVLGFMGTTLEENLSGIHVVKAFNHQKTDSGKFASQANDLYDEQMHAARLMAVNMPTMVLLVSLPTVAILWYGGYLAVNGGTMTIGDITQFIFYTALLAMPIRRLGFLVNIYSRTVSAGQRIMEILDTESEVKEKPGAVDIGRARGEVTFENVSFSYSSIGPALKDVSFTALPGQTVALLGRSGSGKSTIANLLARFYDVTEGRILLDGTDIRDLTLPSLRRNVVAAQQDVFLFSATVKENIAYGATDADMDRIVEVSKAAYLHDAIDALPEKYETWVGERGDTLSGGEKQRLSIARTLLVNPSVLILDDSTASVDARTERLIRQALDRLIKDRTTFVITHRIPIIKGADLILVLDNGEVAERGTHDELMALGGLYKEVYEEQLLVHQRTDDESILEGA
jgi:ABC-type multidrug transport system fused ATPase/permease subunit